MACDNCVDNLKNCDAKCCKQLKFTSHFLTEKVIYYYKIHGCEVSRLPDRTFVITVPMVCPQLKENRCLLHDSPEKPEICQEYGHKFNKLAFPDQCIYPIKN